MWRGAGSRRRKPRHCLCSPSRSSLWTGRAAVTPAALAGAGEEAPSQRPVESCHRGTSGVHNPWGGGEDAGGVFWAQWAPWVPGACLTSFALAGSVQVVVGAQQLALAVDAAVVDAGREVGAQVHLGRHIGAGLEPVAREKGVSPRPAPLGQLLPEALITPRLGR